MCHVLIIEDEPLIALDLEMMLAGAGAMSFDFAVTQAEAVAAAESKCPISSLLTSSLSKELARRRLSKSTERRETCRCYSSPPARRLANPARLPDAFSPSRSTAV
jgi:PleD family two-component response regulator